MNGAAREILAVDPTAFHGVKLTEWADRAEALKPFVDLALAEFAGEVSRQWERQVEYARADGKRILLMRGSRLAGPADNGFVVVFDDITHLIQAQRDAAWGEVARRLAHEIKNPLTPIQLSAERLQLKLFEKLTQSDADMLRRATGTIVSQVTALKGMVDDFSEYARASRMSGADLSLNDLVREVLVLYESMGVSIEPHLQEGLPRIHADPALIRQVLHNLIQNAIDALTGIGDPQIIVTSERSGDGIQLSVRDNGSGIADAMISRIFEPYVTTKPKGTGLGLAIVKKIVDEHRGRIQVENVKPHGANVSIVLPFEKAA